MPKLVMLPGSALPAASSARAKPDDSSTTTLSDYLSLTCSAFGVTFGGGALF